MYITESGSDSEPTSTLKKLYEIQDVAVFPSHLDG